MIELKDIRKTYDPKTKHPVEALKGVSTVFPDTGMVFIVGKSGGGKSTLLNILGGLDTYDEGDFLIDGVSTKDFSPANWDSYRNHYVGFVFQDHHLMPEYSVRENIAFALALQNKSGDETQKIENALKTVDLEGFGGRSIRKLSGGQRQRVAIARALVKEYHMILADEPTGNLDRNTAQEIFQLLKEISKTKLVIVVTHDVAAANAFADMALSISGGKIVDSAAQPSFEQYLTLNPSTSNAMDNSAQSLLLGKYKENNALAKNNNLARKDSEKQHFQLPKTRLSARATWRFIGKSFKKRIMRLIFSVILCVITLTLLTSAFEFIVWDAVKVQTELLNFEQEAILQKYEVLNKGTDYAKTVYVNFNSEDIRSIEKKFPNAPFYPIFACRNGFSQLGRELSNEEETFYNGAYTGFCQIDEVGLQSLNYTLLAGEYPTTSKEVMISAYDFEIYQLCGYQADRYAEPIKIESYQDLLGKEITLSLTSDYGVPNNKESSGYEKFVICGIIDTNIDSGYEKVKAYATGKGGKPNQKYRDACVAYFRDLSRHNVLYVNRQHTFNQISYLIHKNSPSENKVLARYVLKSSNLRFEDYYSEMIREHDRMRNFYGAVALGSGFLVGILSVYMLASFIIACIRESKTEIGILRCVGASKRDIVSIFTIEIALISIVLFSLTLLLFGLVGIPILVTIHFEAIVMPVSLHTINLVNVTFLAALILAIVSTACYLPLQQVLRKSPVDILTA